MKRVAESISPISFSSLYSCVPFLAAVRPSGVKLKTKPEMVARKKLEPFTYGFIIHLVSLSGL